VGGTVLAIRAARRPRFTAAEGPTDQRLVSMLVITWEIEFSSSAG
jgi:hypothetical protein